MSEVLKIVWTFIHLKQQCPTFLVPGTDFMEDRFFPQTWGQRDGFGMIQVHYVYCALYF